MKRMIMGALASLACIAGLLTAAPPASAVIYPVVTIQHCLNDPGPIWATGDYKMCIGVKWQRQADGTGTKVTQMYMKTTGNTSWLEPTAIQFFDLKGYYCSSISAVQGCNDAAVTKISPVHSRLRSNMNTTLYPGTTMNSESAVGMISYEGDHHVNNAGDYHIAIVVEYGYGNNVPWAGGACSGTCTGIYFTNQ